MSRLNGIRITEKKAHPGQEQGSARKRRNQKEKAVAWQAEAKRIGISVTELKRQKKEQCRQDMAAFAAVRQEVMDTYAATRRYGYGYY